VDKKILIVEDEFVVANDLRVILKKAGYNVVGIADSYDEAMAMIAEHKPGIVLLDIYLKGIHTGIDLAKVLAEKNIGFVYLSANNNQSVLEAAGATQPYGFLVKPFREKDVLIALDIAYYRHAHSREAKLRTEQSLQLSLNNILAENTDWNERLLNIASAIQTAIPFDFILLGFDKTDVDAPGTCAFFRTGFNEYQVIRISELMDLAGLTAQQYNQLIDVIVAGGLKVYDSNEFDKLAERASANQRLAKKFQLQSALVMPMHLSESVFLFSFYSRRPDTYGNEHVQLLNDMEPAITITINRLLAFDEIKKLTEQLKRERSYPLKETKTNSEFGEIIGTSHRMLHVFDMVSQVACMDTSVLLMGESGTGKELIARAIHNLSPRKEKPMIKVNCAALPANLIESELFGHEKGAFTGATDKRIGKFELANGSTIFLDEIGEMPPDLQVKLLRVLQEKEIERVGGRETIKIDVRIIAATNRNLEQEVADGRFRLDLYYRLNVFPITLPSLKERKEDIPLLAEHFAHKFSKKTGKPFNGINAVAMQELIDYNWPGNIREMENVIEQAFVLNDGHSPLQWGRALVNPISENQASALSDQPKTLTDIKEIQQATERDYILSVLKQTNGRIRGAGGAAEILNLKPTTLESRMEKLGIRKTFYKR
jgi:transcriptional regulator with GAF, ATPase, and Fis domain